jgi:hypothetical protein
MIVPSIQADVILLQARIGDLQLEAIRRGNRDRKRIAADAMAHVSALRQILSDPRLEAGWRVNYG